MRQVGASSRSRDGTDLRSYLIPPSVTLASSRQTPLRVGVPAGFQQRQSGNRSRAGNAGMEICWIPEDCILLWRLAPVWSNYSETAGNGQPAPTWAIPGINLSLVHLAN